MAPDALSEALYGYARGADARDLLRPRVLMSSSVVAP